MSTAIRKQTHTDFCQRLSRVESSICRPGASVATRDTTVARPFAATLTGFGWIYLVVAVSTNRELIASSLKHGSLPAEYHDWIFNGLAAMIVASFIVLALHVFRYFMKTGGKRTNSGGVLVGAIAALVLFYTPSDVWSTGFGMLDGHSRNALASAGAAIEGTFPGLGVHNLAFVSSGGN